MGGSDILKKDKQIIVLGATGYVGKRLVPRLLSAGYRVRAAGRDSERIKDLPWATHPHVEFVKTDVLDCDSLRRVTRDCQAAYYLVHSMNSQIADFARADRQAAQNMVLVSKENGLQRIIYLGGLGQEDSNLSKHLRSRAEVGQIFKSGFPSSTILRAAMIIGSGSASFEILRYIVDRLPLMVTPLWVKTLNQPIAIKNVIEYLAGCLECSETIGRTFDIGGEEVLSYHRLMEIYAEEAGLNKRWITTVPFLPVWLSSLWVRLIAPVPGYITIPLIEGLRNPLICHESSIRSILPQRIYGCREAIFKALHFEPLNIKETSCCGGGTTSPYAMVHVGDPEWAGGTLLTDTRRKVVRTSPENIWQVIARIGGRTGWYHGTWLWILRGYIDCMIGGVGLRREKKDSVELKSGDILDCWRVVKVNVNRCLILEAEMKLPGKATLDFIIRPLNDQVSELQMVAQFRPRGLRGLCYWYILWPAHTYIFGGLIAKIAKIAEKSLE